MPIITNKNAEIIIPSKTSIFKLTHKGKDNLFIIYSPVKIDDISERINKIKDSNIAMDIYSRFEIGFGDITQPVNKIVYEKDRMSFNSTENNKKKIIPIILQVTTL